MEPSRLNLHKDASTVFTLLTQVSALTEPEVADWETSASIDTMDSNTRASFLAWRAWTAGADATMAKLKACTDAGLTVPKELKLELAQREVELLDAFKAIHHAIPPENPFQ